MTTKQQIEENIKSIQDLIKSDDENKFLKIILLELESNRLIHEQNYQELVVYFDSTFKKLDKILKNDSNLTKIDQKLAILTEKKSFLDRIKGIFKK